MANSVSVSGYQKALGLMTQALAILDEMGAPGEIGAHLDLAICTLQSSSCADSTIKQAAQQWSQDSCAWPLMPSQ